MSRRTWISNLLLVAGLLLVGTPLLMHVYGGWAQRRQREAILQGLPPSATTMPEDMPAVTPSKHRAPVIPAAHRRVPVRHKASPQHTPAKPIPPSAQPTEGSGTADAAPASKAGTQVASKPAPKSAPRKAPPSAPEETAATVAMVKPEGPLPRRKWEPCVVQIPRIDVDAAVARGVGNWRMITGPAYEVWSAGPGGAGNPVIAAHRNMWDETFMHLPRVRPGDPVYIVTRTHRYVYRVDRSRQATTGERNLLDDTKDPRITLYTCVLPFNKNRRWVVQGHLVGIQDLQRGRMASRG